jgi:hypothetical protein
MPKKKRTNTKMSERRRGSREREVDQTILGTTEKQFPLVLLARLVVHLGQDLLLSSSKDRTLPATATFTFLGGEANLGLAV